MFSLADKTRDWTRILKITWLLILNIDGLYCAILTTYILKEMYTNLTCSTNWVQFLANSPIMCATTCSLTRACTASLYHKNNKTCFNIRGEPSNDECPMELSGAQHYVKDYHCPPTWKRVGWSCYRLTDENTSYYATEANCQRLSNESHLAYIKTSHTKEQLKSWLMDDVFKPVFTVIWIGAYANGNEWFWSDGMPVKPWNWAHREPDNFPSSPNCMVLYNEYIEWGDRSCEFESRTGLCQLDLV